MAVSFLLKCANHTLTEPFGPCCAPIRDIVPIERTWISCHPESELEAPAHRYGFVFDDANAVVWHRSRELGLLGYWIIGLLAKSPREKRLAMAAGSSRAS